MKNEIIFFIKKPLKPLDNRNRGGGIMILEDKDMSKLFVILIKIR